MDNACSGRRKRLLPLTCFTFFCSPKQSSTACDETMPDCLLRTSSFNSSVTSQSIDFNPNINCRLQVSASKYLPNKIWSARDWSGNDLSCS